MEVMLSMLIFTMMILMFAAVFPVVVRGAQFSDNYTQGAELAQHKLDQIHASGYSKLFDDTSGTAQTKLGSIIDLSQPASYPVTNPAGFPTGSTAYYFTETDSLLNFFPGGSTGIVTIAPDPNAPIGKVADVTVTITWTGGAYAGGSYTSRTKVANIN